MAGGAGTEQIRRVRTQMNPDIFMIFDKLPATLSLNEVVEGRLMTSGFINNLIKG